MVNVIGVRFKPAGKTYYFDPLDFDIKQGDKLQAFSYGINYKIENVMLLYPKHLDNVKYDLVLGKESIVNLKIRTIDLNFSGNNYKEYIDEIRERVEIVL